TASNLGQYARGDLQALHAQGWKLRLRGLITATGGLPCVHTTGKADKILCLSRSLRLCRATTASNLGQYARGDL
ncbi:hypothetical protein EG332_15815, partial [Pectobacterium versatile]